MKVSYSVEQPIKIVPQLCEYVFRAEAQEYIGLGQNNELARMLGSVYCAHSSESSVCMAALAEPRDLTKEVHRALRPVARIRNSLLHKTQVTGFRYKKQDILFTRNIF